MINSTCTGKPKKSEADDEKWTVYMQLEPSHIGDLLSQATKFLLNYLNFGNFEGATGANSLVVGRLALIRNMLYIACNATDKDNKKILSSFFTEVEGK